MAAQVRPAGQAERIEDAIWSLVDSFKIEDYDEAIIDDDKRDKAYDRIRQAVDSAQPGGPIDPNQIADTIRKQLLRDDREPDKALRFSNLYSRLIAQPVLQHKGAILHLLHELGDYQSLPPHMWRRPPAAPPLASPQTVVTRLTRSDDDGRPWTPETRIPYHYSPRTPSDQMSHRGEHRHAPPSSVPRTYGKRVQEHVPKRIEGPRSDRERTPTERTPTELDYASTPTPAAPPAASPTPTPAPPSLPPPPTEAALLRDLPYTLQGLSSNHLHFSKDGSLRFPPSLSPPMISLLHTLAEPSLLYRELSAFTRSSEGGLIAQSLRAAIEGELLVYLELVGTLEGRIRRALAGGDASGDASTAPSPSRTAGSWGSPSVVTEIHSPGKLSGSTVALGRLGVTLKRCVVWTREATMKLRLMAVMVEESKRRGLRLSSEIVWKLLTTTGKKGGQAISLIHDYSSSYGDPFVGNFAERLLSRVTQPFYDMLRRWIYDGELSDPYQEFFVLERPSKMNVEVPVDGRARAGAAASVWEDKYRLEDEMVPTIISKEQAKKIFLIGKSLNFIRYGCGDAAWVEKSSKETSKELQYGDRAMLEASIDEAYRRTMARLMDLMTHKFKLLDHLRAMKKYLLLGQGDFIAVLIEGLASSLERPANTLYRHHLTAQLEHAIRGSNAQYDAVDVLRRLDARMLMQGHGDLGWDCFTLEYKVDAPIDVIITPDGSREYLKVFNFLWRIRRVEYGLGTTWRRCMTGARGILANVTDKVGKDWRGAHCCLAEMIHFVSQLQYYILFEVIQSSWDELEAAVSKSDSTLDDLIGAHARYLQAITHKGLLGSTGRSQRRSGQENGFLLQLHEMLKVMLAYREAIDGLYSFSVDEFTRRQATIETQSSASGDESDVRHEDNNPSNDHRQDGTPTGRRRDKESDSHNSILESLRTRLHDLSTDFRTKLNVLLGDLTYHPDSDVRFLGVMMNFNDVYEPVRKEKKTTRKDGHGQDHQRSRSSQQQTQKQQQQRQPSQNQPLKQPPQRQAPDRQPSRASDNNRPPSQQSPQKKDDRPTLQRRKFSAQQVQQLQAQREQQSRELQRQPSQREQDASQMQQQTDYDDDDKKEEGV